MVARPLMRDAGLTRPWSVLLDGDRRRRAAPAPRLRAVLGRPDSLIRTTRFAPFRRDARKPITPLRQPVVAGQPLLSALVVIDKARRERSPGAQPGDRRGEHR